MNLKGPDECSCGATSDSCSTIAPECPVAPSQQSIQHDVRPKRVLRPFVAQDGQCLYLVEPAPRGWVVAELEFDPASCVFVLRRQTEYEWPREALGRLLSRVISPQSMDDREMRRMSDAFTDWLATQFAA